MSNKHSLQINDLPICPQPASGNLSRIIPKTNRQCSGIDWLLDGSNFKSGVYRSEDGQKLVLTNGLIQRVWRLSPNAACIAFDNLMTGESILRAVRPEAKLKLNGQNYNIGGLAGQPNHAYLATEWLDSLTADPEALQFAGFRIGSPTERFAWKCIRHHAPDAKWPPEGVALEMDFVFSSSEQEVLGNGDLTVTVHYELYDGIPALCKWLTVHNDTSKNISIDSFTSEVLAVVPYEDPVEWREISITPPDLHVETDYAFGGGTHKSSSKHSVHWVADPEYHTQVNYENQNPCLLEVRPSNGPAQEIAPGETFATFRAFELVYDSTDRERKGLALRRLYRIIAPWLTENPLILHVVSSDPGTVRQAIDQAAECGFEMVNLSFGSGLNMEDESPDNLAKFKDLADYVHSKGKELGGYSLLSSRRIQPDSDNIMNPETGEPGGQTHGYCPALASDWGQNYFRKLRRFFEHTGFLQFTHDGSYPGDVDAAARPPLQKGKKDSQWVQWKIITEFYQWQRAQGIYLRVPDYYFLSGSNECGMGYREVNWSLPRIQQQIHTRQNIYDGTWEKIPSMGWMFVPLTQYHGGGEAATIEPLQEHLEHYELMMASNLLLGVQAVYRGLRLYDTEETKNMVQKLVALYKKHRDILESDLIHLRRADGHSIDAMLHVNPRLDEKGFLAVFNPLSKDVEENLVVPLYYTGLESEAKVSHEDGETITYQLYRDYSIILPVHVPARGYTWFVIRE